MSTLLRTTLFAPLPDTLRGELLKHYDEICRNFAESRWEPAELNGGKLCEVVYTIIVGTLAGAYPARASKPRDFPKACRDLEGQPRTPHSADRSLRILVPRVLTALYEIRNNRGVGHTGGDVDPNHMDATVVHAMARWVVAELVRILHGVSTSDAQGVVESLTERVVPVIWTIGATKRVQRVGLPKKEEILLLLYSEAGWVATETLRSWAEYKNSTLFRRTVLEPLHKARLLELEPTRAHLSPMGIKHVETSLLKDLLAS